MNRNPLDHINIRTAVCAALTVLAMGSAHAQNTGAPSYAGASIASTDYGTGLKVFLGGKITPIFGWEGQLTSFGSEEYRPGYKHSATAIGASGTARFPLNASLSAFGKAGLHYVQPRQSGPGATPTAQSSWASEPASSGTSRTRLRCASSWRTSVALTATSLPWACSSVSDSMLATRASAAMPRQATPAEPALPGRWVAPLGGRSEATGGLVRGRKQFFMLLAEHVLLHLAHRVAR
jgi:hypothetical protein